MKSVERLGILQCRSAAFMGARQSDRGRGGGAGESSKRERQSKAKQSRAERSGAEKSLLIMAMPPYPPGNRNS